MEETLELTFVFKEGFGFVKLSTAETRQWRVSQT